MEIIDLTPESSGSGTSNYGDLSNKPQINSVTLSGNKSLNDLSIMSNENYIPTNTTITVETDGTGDYTTLGAAINYLNNKWSDGIVNISIGAGTFTEASTNINGYNFNIPHLVVTGDSNATTILDYSSTSSNAITISNSSVEFKDLKIYKSAKTNSGFFVNQEASFYCNNVAIDGFLCGINTVLGSTTQIISGLSISNSTSAICASKLGNIATSDNIQINLTDCSYGFYLTNCSFVCVTGTVNYTNVTNHANLTVNTMSANGFITGVS